MANPKFNLFLKLQSLGWLTVGYYTLYGYTPSLFNCLLILVLPHTIFL